MATAVALAAVVSIRPGVHGVGTATNKLTAPQSLTWHSTRSLGVSAWLCFGSANAGYLFVFVPSPFASCLFGTHRPALLPTILLEPASLSKVRSHIKEHSVSAGSLASNRALRT